ncbi:3',5'-cyclic-AMP phosphodiesterase, partial [Proteus sp. G2661]|nr:3',5'-cyclic-AMP phosphodiesterase [Proteus sp. G2661]
MESQLELSVKHKNTVRILQITDTHLFANVEDTLL